MARKIIAGTYKFVDAPEKLSQFTSATNILFDDSNGTVINYTTAPLPGITTDQFVLAVDRPNETQRYILYAFQAVTSSIPGLRIDKGWYWFNESSTSVDTISTPSVVFSDNCSINDELTTTQGNALFTSSPIQDQPAVTTTRVFYKGKKELTMAQFEALTNLDDAVDYDIVDFPNGGITNAQMTAALGYSRLFGDGEIYVCSDNGTYTKGNWYQIKVEGGVKSWEDITKGLKIYAVTDILNHDGIKSGTFTEEQINNIILADILQVYAIDGDPIYKYAYKGLYPTNPVQSTISANLYFVAATEKGNYVLAINTDTRNWEVREPVSGDLQNYVPKQSELSPVALTWRFNDVVDVNRDAFTVNFTSDGVNYTEIGFKWSLQQSPAPKDTMYYSGPTKFPDVYYGQWGGETPDTNPYRTVTFETAPSGELLTWLQANAVPQSEVDPNTALTWTVNNPWGSDSEMATFGWTSINFTSNGKKFIQFCGEGDVGYTLEGQSLPMWFHKNWTSNSGYAPLGVSNGDDLSMYRTVTFETAPTGTLLEWLKTHAVPQGSSTKTYAQVTNENGAVAIRVFENSDADLQNLSITKDGVTINGEKPLTSVQPLYKHELVIPYSFSVTDSETVNGSVVYHYLSNTGTQITSASEIDDNFLLSGGVGKNSANTAASQSESAALTWTINDTNATPPTTRIETSIKFSVQNDPENIGTNFDTILISNTEYISGIQYNSITTGWNHVADFDGNSLIWNTKGADTSAYRTITFETAPTGRLLEWLQSNAVPQGGVDSNTVLLFNVNVTKEGSSITVEAVNASTMGYITGTVGTITDTVTQLI